MSYFWDDEQDWPRIGRIIKVAALTILGIIMMFGSWFTVGAGYRGVIVRFGAVSATVDQGLHFKVPIIDQVVHMSTRLGKAQTESAASSKDLQIVHSNIVVNYSLDPAKVSDIYRNIGLEWETRLIDPTINETFKAVTARYTAEELIQKRHEASAAIKTDLASRLAPYGFLVRETAIVNFDFSKVFNEAIEAKQTAEQLALKATRDLERVKKEAEQKVAMAQAESESLRLQKQNVSAELLQLRAIEKWNGVLPQITSGAVPFIDVAKATGH